MHVSTLFRYSSESRMMQSVSAAGGVSAARSRDEAGLTEKWPHALWADAFG